jgi:hypothetical protein
MEEVKQSIYFQLFSLGEFLPKDLCLYCAWFLCWVKLEDEPPIFGLRLGKSVASEEELSLLTKHWPLFLRACQKQTIVVEEGLRGIFTISFNNACLHFNWLCIYLTVEKDSGFILRVSPMGNGCYHAITVNDIIGSVPTLNNRCLMDGAVSLHITPLQQLFLENPASVFK